MTLKLTEDLPGFVDSYSTSSTEEDKAEVFAAMICDPEWLARRIQRDPVLESKVQRIRETLARCDPSMDESFWKAVALRHASSPR